MTTGNKLPQGGTPLDGRLGPRKPALIRSDSPSCPDLPSSDRLHEGGVVGFGLVGIGDREPSHRAIEAVGVAAIAIQNRGVTRASVRLREHLSAYPRVFLQCEAAQLFRVARGFVIRELTHEVV